MGKGYLPEKTTSTPYTFHRSEWKEFTETPLSRWCSSTAFKRLTSLSSPRPQVSAGVPGWDGTWFNILSSPIFLDGSKPIISIDEWGLNGDEHPFTNYFRLHQGTVWFWLTLILFCKAYQTHMFCKDRLAPATIPSQTDVCLIDSWLNIDDS